MELRPYQERTIAEARRQYVAGSRAICMVVPTGGGKTVIASEMCRKMAAQGKPVLWLAHRIELVDQARARVPDGVEVATIQGLLASGKRPPAELVIIDECHHLQASVWRGVADHYQSSLRIGLTATPERADGKPLGDIFTSLVVGAKYSELIAAGHLVDCEVFAPVGGHKKALAMPIHEAIAKWAPDKQSIVFCATVNEAIDGAAKTPNSIELDANTPLDERESLLFNFRHGDINHVFNVYILTEGFDAPAASCCILARGCGHASTYLQMVGRVLRPAQGKTIARVVDLCGSSEDHGWPTEDREYSLDGRAISRTSKKSDPIWQCKNCGMCYQKPPTDRRCQSCGYKIPEPEALKIQKRQMVRKKRNATASPETKAREYERLKRMCLARGHNIGRAAHIYKGRYGHWPSS